MKGTAKNGEKMVVPSKTDKAMLKEILHDLKEVNHRVENLQVTTSTRQGSARLTK
jgi:hypothetical protein